MFEIWIPITIFAAFSQNLRSIYQKKLQKNISNISSTYTRFLFGLPFVFIYFLFLYNYSNTTFLVSNINLQFIFYCLIGGISQIIATFLLLKIFMTNNFSVATAYSKTEPIQAAFFGFILLSDPISFIGFIGILIGLIGIMITSIKKVNLSINFFNLSVFYGLLSGSLFGLAAVLFRGASHSLFSIDYILTSSFTLLIAIGIQTLILTIYILIKDIKQFYLLYLNWKDSLIVGFFGAFASICWFYAMSVQNVAYVRALGQIELIFTILASIFYFKEKIIKTEILGILITLTGILIILFNI
ncbi:MAG: DMT family transporter [Alphaproteobacteria bacterium]|jgi:drug/metabolite transporter (DMT)-like permease|nr:DMT family transporter [Alphaproteobacteria bacterium]